MTAAMLVLEPIFEADLPPEQYAYRPGRNAQQAVVEVEETKGAATDRFHLPPPRHISTLPPPAGTGRAAYVRSWQNQLFPW